MNRIVLSHAAILLTCVCVSSAWAQSNIQQQAARGERLSAEVAELEEKGDHVTAARYQQEVVAIYQNLLGRENPDTLRQLNYLGLLQAQAGDFVSAQRNLEQCWNVRRRLLGEDHEDTGEVRLNLGLVAQNLADYETARQHYRSALAIFRARHGEDHEYTLQVLSNYSILFAAEGNYDKAEEFAKYVLEIRQRKVGDNHVETAQSLHNLGYVYFLQGNFSDAREYYDQALVIHQQQLGPQHDDTLQSLSNLAMLEDELGNFAKARELYTQVHTIRRGKYGPEHGDVGESLLNLGNIYLRQGDMTQARAYYDESLKIFWKTRGPEHPDTLQVMNNLAVLYDEQGDFPAARKYHTQVLEARKKMLGTEHAATVESMVNLGSVAYNEKNVADARSLFEESVRIATKQLGDEHPTTLQAMNNLAVLLQHQGDYEAAETLTLQVLASRRKVLGDGHPAIGESLFNVAWLYHDSGDYTRARDYYQQALINLEAKLGNAHARTQLVMTALGMLESVDGNPEEASRLVDRARRSRRTSLSRLLSGMSPAEQLKFITNDQSYHLALTLGLELRDQQNVVDASAGWLINAKGVSQESLAARELLTRDLGNPQGKEISNQLLEVRRRLAQLVVSIPEPKQKDARKEAIEELTQTELQLSRALAQLVGEPTNMGQWVELDEIRAALAEDEVFLNVALFNPYDIHSERKSVHDRSQPAHYAVWIIPAAGQGEVQIVDLGLAEEIDQQVNAIRQVMGAAGLPDGPLIQQGEVAAEEQFREASQKLNATLWQSLADRLPAGVNRLTLSPDGALWLLPWAALPVADEKYLIEDYALRFVVSGRELVAPEHEVASNPPLLFANPAFDLGPEKIRAAIQAIFRDIVFGENAQRGLVSQSALGRVSPLPGTLLEAEAISPSVERITGKPPVKYLGQYALESVVKRVRSPEVMVLSTHGFFLQDQQVSKPASLAGSPRSSALLTVEGKPVENPLLRCGLLLAGCNSPSSGMDDGVLTGMEIVGLDLRGTDLVVLSACETGIGKVQIGEGVAGLRQAFHLAGAKGVVSTLWQVPDRDSALIMRDFFENLANDEPQAEALRGAQLQRIENRRQRYGAAHPFFWAAWTVTGE